MAEGTELVKNRFERVSQETAKQIRECAESMGLTATAYSFYDKSGNKVVFESITQGGVNVPKNVAQKLTQYVHQNVLKESGNLGRKDCAKVAGSAVKSLPAVLDNDFYVGTLGTNLKHTNLQAFRELGYNHHIINFLEKDFFIAVDLTAGYTMDAEQGNYSAFAVAGESEEIVLKTLKALTGTKWEMR